MGVIRITAAGSFPVRSREFGAMEHGHAHAVAEAIAWLSSDLLPAAIDLDHRLHDEGSRPTGGFEKGAEHG